MEYLTVGTREITKELFVPVKDKVDRPYKPSGGMWFSEHIFNSYNAWVAYLLANPSRFVSKNHSDNLWEQPCSLITVRDSSNFFRLDSEGALDTLIRNYPCNSGGFSYERLSRNYDGIYVDVSALYRCRENEKIFAIAQLYKVKTLLLFNLDCILYYSPGFVSITPFNLDCYNGDGDDITYSINIENSMKRIR